MANGQSSRVNRNGILLEALNANSLSYAASMRQQQSRCTQIPAQRNAMLMLMLMLKTKVTMDTRTLHDHCPSDLGVSAGAGGVDVKLPPSLKRVGCILLLLSVEPVSPPSLARFAPSVGTEELLDTAD